MAGSTVSQLRAGPTESELARLEEEITERLGSSVDMRPPGAAQLSAVPPLADEPKVSAKPALNTEPTPPLRVPHREPPQGWRARTLLVAAAIALAGVGYGVFRLWQVHLESSERIAAEARQSTQPAAPTAPAASIPVPDVAPPKPAVVAPPRPAVVASPKPAAVASPPPAVRAPQAESVRGGVAGAPRSSTVTHTRRESPSVAATAAAPVAPVPVAAQPANCAEAIVALGLCAKEVRK